MRILLTVSIGIMLFMSCGSSPTQDDRTDGSVGDAAAETAAPVPEQKGPEGLRAVYPDARLVLASPVAELYRIALPSMREIPDFEGGKRLIYSLGEAEVVVHTADGPEEANWMPGEVYALPGGVLRLENRSGGRPLEFLMLMRSDEPLQECTPSSSGPGTLSKPRNGKIIYDADGIFALEYTLGAGNLAASLPNAPFLYYGLDDGLISVSEGLNTGKARRTMNGFANWMSGCSTRLSNAGETPVKFVIMGYWAEGS